MSTSPIQKTAVDAEAERYWSAYYADSGYGKQWTRSIPKRVRAELLRAARASKTASTLPKEAPSIMPLATVIGESGVSLEGLAVYGQGKDRVVRAFAIEFDHDGSVTDFATVAAK